MPQSVKTIQAVRQKETTQIKNDTTAETTETPLNKAVPSATTTKTIHETSNKTSGKRLHDESSVLLLFCLISFLTYFDRGTFAAARTFIQNTFSMNNFQFGVAGGLYLVGFSCSGPLFAYFSNYLALTTIIRFGLIIWTLSSLFSGLSFNFTSLSIARTFTGIGEASFLCIAPPLIDLLAPKESRSRSLSIFYCSIPFGFASGYIFSGQWIEQTIFGSSWTWRSIFILQSILMIVLIAMSYFVQCPKSLLSLQIVEVNESQNETSLQKISLIGEIRELISNSVYIAIVFGYAAQTFVLGGFALYGPDYVKIVFDYGLGRATLIFGTITIFAGIGGTFFGGLMLDFLRTRNIYQEGTNSESSSVAHACFLIFIFSVMAIPLGLAISFLKHIALFFITMFLLEFFTFSQISPINSVVLWSNSPTIRALALATCVIVIHLCGDAISPPFVGFLLDTIKCNGPSCKWTFSILILSTWLVISSCLFYLAYHLSLKRVNRSDAIKTKTQFIELFDPIYEQTEPLACEFV